MLSLIALKLCGRRRRSHVRDIVHDPALGTFAGLNVLPKTWHLGTYSYRTQRAQQLAFFEALQPRLRDAGLLGESGLNLDFHTIMSYGEDTILDKHYVPRRSQRTRSVLTFIAQDGEQRTILYANAELTARQQSGEVIEFCRFYERTHGTLPKLLVFDQKLTTQAHLAELDELGVGFITLAPALPETDRHARRARRRRMDQDPPGPRRQAPQRHLPRRRRHDQRPRLAPDRRQRPRPRTSDPDPHQPTAPTVKQLIERYGQRWGIENQLAEQIRAFHLDSLCSQVPLAVDFDVALTYSPTSPTAASPTACTPPTTTRPPTRSAATSPTASANYASAPGHVEVRLKRRTHTPALLDAGYQDRRIEVPWWGGRTLSYSFPA